MIPAWLALSGWLQAALPTLEQSPLAQLEDELSQVQAALTVSDDQTALRHAEAARALLPRLPADAHAARADVWTNLGAVHMVRGELAAAETLLRRSLTIARAHAPASPALLRVLNNLGYVQRDRGGLREAHALLTEATALAEQLEVDPQFRFAIRHNLAQVDYARGDFVGARAGFAAGVAHFQALEPGGPRLGSSYLGLAASALREGDLAAAEDAERHAAQIFSALPDSCRCSALPLLELGLAALRRNQLDLAQERLQRAFDLQQALTPDAGLYLAAVLRGQAALALRRGRLPEAQTQAQRALDLELAEPQSGLTRVSSWHLLGRIADARGDRAGAGKAWCAAMDALDPIDLPYPGDPLSQARFHGSHVEIYVGCVRARLEAGQPRAAWRAWQQSRARGWREALAQQGLAAPDAKVESTVAAGTLAVDYVVSHDRTLLFVRDGRDLTVHTLPIGAALLGTRVRALRELIQRRADADLPAIRQLAARLHTDLLAPVADRLDQYELLAIGADDVLHALPFAALWDAGRQQWLLEQIALVHVDGVVTASRSGPEPASEPDRLLAVADPQPLGTEALTQDPVLRGQIVALPPLPGARREVRAIRETYGPARSELLIGAPATASRIRKAAQKASVLHFAVHGLFDPARPLDSALLLAHEATRPDGLLTAAEVFRDWRLPQARLVVLSACETALGADFGAEGVLGLSRAFRHAGADAVLATLWRIDDGGAVALMRAFHSHWHERSAHRQRLVQLQRSSLAAMKSRSGQSGRANVGIVSRGTGGIAVSPSARQDAFVGHPDMPHPFYWAGFLFIASIQ